MTDFLTFYGQYPRKREKKDAEKAWNGLMKKGVDPELIIATLKERIRSEWCHWQPQFIPYPASFLRAESFDFNDCEAAVDDPEPPPLFRVPSKSELLEHAERVHMGLRIDRERWDAERKVHRHDRRCQWGGLCRFSDDMEPPYVPDLAEIVEAMKHGR